MTIIGYLRVSTDKQDVARQRHAILEHANLQNLKVRFHEYKVSSTKSTAERGIDTLLTQLQNGDSIIVSELSRLGRSLGQIIRIIDDLINKGIIFTALKENIHVNGAKDRQSKLLIAMFGLLAELERDLISERTKEGMQAAKRRGVRFGRPKGQLGKSRLSGQEDYIQLLLEKKVSQTAIARILDVSPTTLRHFVKTRRLKRKERVGKSG